MTFKVEDQLGLACRFDVVVDGFSLGSWSKCQGLGVRFKHDPVRELGEHSFTTYLPGRADYTPVKLQRALKAGDWNQTKAWLEEVTDDSWITDGGQHTASITLRDSKLDEVATWDLRNAMPKSWRGPQLDATGKAVAIETLELVHQGFLG